MNTEAIKEPRDIVAADRLDLVRRLFAVAISIGVGSTFITADWISEGRWPSKIEADQIAIVCVALFATVLSWDGYLSSVRRKPLYDAPRFTIDVILIFTYLFLIVTSDKSEYWLPIICIMYGLYVTWDILTVYQFPSFYDHGVDSEAPRAIAAVLRVYSLGTLDRKNIDRGPIISLSWAAYFMLLLAISLKQGMGTRTSLVFAALGLWLYRRDKRLVRGDVRGYRMIVRALLIALLLGAALGYVRYAEGFLKAAIQTSDQGRTGAFVVKRNIRSPA